jgi:hypothetical protein
LAAAYYSAASSSHSAGVVDGCEARLQSVTQHHQRIKFVDKMLLDERRSLGRSTSSD